MIKFILSVIFSYSLLYSQNILHEDFIVSIGDKIYSPFSDKPFTEEKKLYKICRLNFRNRRKIKRALDT